MMNTDHAERAAVAIGPQTRDLGVETTFDKEPI
jgi:hypothetical protein